MANAEAMTITKKTKDRSKNVVVEAAEIKDVSMDADALHSNEDGTSHTESKKRKRDSAPTSELEIDINRPEPPSKKALRKAKKQKTGASTTAGDENKSQTTEIGKQESAVVNEADKDLNGQETKRSLYGIWIGNLAFAVTKAMLRDFFVNNSESISADDITRVHMPAPAKATSSKTSLKPQNKGFAYVDFSSSLALYAAIGLSESTFGGRRVLIKDAKSFEGRPEKTAQPEENAVNANSNDNKPPSKRVFVGNLGFEVTKEDLHKHFQQCGEVENVHIAQFEDTGNCKGYAWITFAEAESAKTAVIGWLRKPIDGEDDGSENSDQEIVNAKQDPEKSIPSKPEITKADKKAKTRKWFVNRLLGRALRCEFAEDPTTRYKKRYGKEAKIEGDKEVNHEEIHANDFERPAHTRHQPERRARHQKVGHGPRTGVIKPGEGTNADKRRGGKNPTTQQDKTEPTESLKLKPGLAETRYRTGAVAESKGEKITFG